MHEQTKRNPGPGSKVKLLQRPKAIFAMVRLQCPNSHVHSMAQGGSMERTFPACLQGKPPSWPPRESWGRNAFNWLLLHPWKSFTSLETQAGALTSLRLAPTSCETTILSPQALYFFFIIYLFIFACTWSSLLHAGYSLVEGHGLLIGWLLFLLSMGSRVHGLQ